MTTTNTPASSDCLATAFQSISRRGSNVASWACPMPLRTKIDDRLHGRTVVLENVAFSRWYYPVLAPFSNSYAAKALRARSSAADIAVLDHTVSAAFPKIVFAKNSKAGCTSIVHAIYSLAKGTEYNGKIHEETEVLSQGVNAWNILAARRSDPNYTTSTFVRNPIDRLESAFRDFVVEQRNPSFAIHSAALAEFGCETGKSDQKNLDAFLDYVEMCFQVSRIRTDRHWRPQVDNIGFERFDYDFVGKVENMENDLRTLFAMAGISADEINRVAPVRKNSSRSSSRIAGPAQVSRIRDLYAEDFEAFGYD